MAYFDGVKIGDRVWDFEFEWGTVIKLLKASDLDSQNITFESNFVVIEVKFDNIYFGCGYYDLNGVAFYSNGNQTLFWDEIKFEIPEKPKVKLKEKNYFIDLEISEVVNGCKYAGYGSGLRRDDKETAEKALKQIKRFTRLLALRDQECPDSRGYEFQYGNKNFYIYKDHSNARNPYTFSEYYNAHEEYLTVYFKTKEDVQRICDILNTSRFNLEGE